LLLAVLSLGDARGAQTTSSEARAIAKEAYVYGFRLWTATVSSQAISGQQGSEYKGLLVYMFSM
jgi:hypothetical protein